MSVFLNQYIVDVNFCGLSFYIHLNIVYVSSYNKLIFQFLFAFHFIYGLYMVLCGDSFQNRSESGLVFVNYNLQPLWKTVL